MTLKVTVTPGESAPTYMLKTIMGAALFTESEAATAMEIAQKFVDRFKQGKSQSTIIHDEEFSSFSEEQKIHILATLNKFIEQNRN